MQRIIKQYPKGYYIRPRPNHQKSSFTASATPPPSTAAPSLEPIQVDTPYHFYQNGVLEPYLNQPVHANTLRQYIMFGRQMNAQRLIKSANWVCNELLIRLSHRIRDFQQLPFIVGTNPNIEWPYRVYWSAFETLRKTPPIKTAQDNAAFCSLLNELLEDAQDVLPRMALGVTECASFYQPHDNTLDRFLNRMMQSRISRRLLAEQHVALTKTYCGSTNDEEPIGDVYNARKGKQVGIFNTECSAPAIFSQVQSLVTSQYSTPMPRMELHLQGQDDITFAYIPEQLEHILYELLHNATKYTLRRHHQDLPPIQITISANTTDVFFRISDQGGGIALPKYNRLWSYQERANKGDFKDVKHLPNMPMTLAERFKRQQQQPQQGFLGIGLILSKVYAEYWGGELQVVTMDGLGTDAYVRIPRNGLWTENIGIDMMTTGRTHHHRQNHHEAPLQYTRKQQPPIGVGSSSDSGKSTTRHHHHIVKHSELIHNQKGWSLSSIIAS